MSLRYSGKERDPSQRDVLENECLGLVFELVLENVLSSVVDASLLPT